MNTASLSIPFVRKCLACCPVWAIVVLALSGCNSGVFVDDFLPDIPSLSLTEEENRATVSFEADNWGILRSDYMNGAFQTWATDLEGNSIDLPLGEGQPGIVYIRDDFFDLRVEKRNRRELSVSILENLYDYPFELSLVVGNCYEEKSVPLRVGPTAKYRVDSVSYDWSQFFTYDYKAEWVYSIIVDNTQSTDTTWAHIRPYEKAARRVRFSILGEVMGKDYYTTILGDPLPEVAIPDVADGQPVMQDTRVPFDTEEQDLPVDLDKDFSVPVPVPGGKKMEVSAYVSIEYYHVPFAIHCSHPRSGRTRTFSGILRSERPYDYFFTKTDLTETDE